MLFDQRAPRRALMVGGLLCASAPALATSSDFADDGETGARDDAEEIYEQEQTQGSPSGSAVQGDPPSGVAGGPPGGKPVFDETWVTVGVGAGLVPSYSGSDDYNVFPLPLIVGRVGGIGITPNGPGIALDLLSQPPSPGEPETSVSFGPTFRLRNDRDGNFGDDVVALAGELDTAIEVGAQGGISIPAVLHEFDRLSLSTQVRWDILGAHDGMLIEPSVSYFTPVSRGAAVQLSVNASFVDDSFADYYYSVTPEQSVASGLPEFTADGGLNSVGVLALVTFDLSGELLDGGFNIYGVGGYSQLVGDAADTPYTSIRGSAGQFIGGIGIGYTF